MCSSDLEVHFHDEVGDRRFAEELETHCYRIVQEALTNCLKHAAAGNVWVSLVLGAGEIRLEIQDDGNGFDVDSTLGDLRNRGSLGLLGMRERAEMLGGDLRVVSAGGEGTMIRCRIPITEMEQERGKITANQADVKLGVAAR